MTKENEKDVLRFRGLLRLAGTYQDGSETTITLTQDDATRCCFVFVGNKRYGTDRSSFRSAIDAAIADLPKETK